MHYIATIKQPIMFYPDSHESGEERDRVYFAKDSIINFHKDYLTRLKPYVKNITVTNDLFEEHANNISRIVQYVTIDNCSFIEIMHKDYLEIIVLGMTDFDTDARDEGRIFDIATITSIFDLGYTEHERMYVYDILSDQRHYITSYNGTNGNDVDLSFDGYNFKLSSTIYNEETTNFRFIVPKKGVEVDRRGI